MNRRLAAIALTFVAALPLACESTITTAQTSGSGAGGNSGGTSSSSSTTTSTSGSIGSSGGKTTSGGPGTGTCDGQTPLPNPPPPMGNACNCSAATGIAFDGECGGLVLAAPYDVSTMGGPYCDPEIAFATSYVCKQWFSYSVQACVSPNVAPCIQIKHENFDSVGDVRSGTFIDGAGETWTLSSIVFGDMDILSQATSFKALATHATGQTMTLTGTINVCLASTSVCPI